MCRNHFRLGNAVCTGLTALAVFASSGRAQVFPGATWVFKTPAEVGLDSAKLDDFKNYVGGRGCVVRYGYMAYTWGDQSYRQDVASACKPWYSHFLFKAVEDGKLSSLDELAVDWESCLYNINPGLGYKGRNITFRHMANQISCYGVRENPGTAFDYNDWQMALFFDTLFLEVYNCSSWSTIDSQVLHPQLTDLMQCQDNPTFMAFGTGDRPGRVRVSVRDFARFGLLYLNAGNWDGSQLISQAYAITATTSALPNSIPRTNAQQAQMCPGQRSIGSTSIPDDQTDHKGSYSFAWWTNGIDRYGQRHWPDAPIDTYGAFGHGNGKRAVAVIPSLDMVVSWNDTVLDGLPGNPQNEAFKRLVAAVVGGSPVAVINADPTSGRAPLTVEFDGSDSYDGDGTIVSHEWDFDDDGTIDDIGAAASHEYTEVGDYTARLIVTDDDDLTDSTTVQIAVEGLPGDFDGDGDVDQEDFGHFQICLSGSGVPQTDPTCQDALLDDDEDVDHNDFGIFQECIGGPNNPPGC